MAPPAMVAAREPSRSPWRNSHRPIPGAVALAAFGANNIPGLNTWFDASNNGSFTAPGGAIEEWADTVGGNVLVATGAPSPTRQALPDGRLAAKFIRGTSTALGAVEQATGIPMTVFIACTRDADANFGEAILSVGSALTHGASLTAQVGSSQLIWRIGAGAAPVALWQSSNVAAGNIVGVTMEAGSTTSYHNGTATSWTATTPNFGAEPTMIVGSAPGEAGYGGAVFEIVIYNRALGEADRQKLEGYLAHKWELAGALPSNHPYKSAAPQ